MQLLAVGGASEIRVRDRAVSVLRAAGVAPRDYMGELAALYEFVRDTIRDTRDIYGVETLQTPGATLSRGAGDCDDKAVLLVSLLLSVGHPARLSFRAAAYDGSATFSHVYVEAETPSGRLALDPTAGAVLGWEHPSTLSGVLTL